MKYSSIDNEQIRLGVIFLFCVLVNLLWHRKKRLIVHLSTHMNIEMSMYICHRAWPILIHAYILYTYIHKK